MDIANLNKNSELKTSSVASIESYIHDMFMYNKVLPNKTRQNSNIGPG